MSEERARSCLPCLQGELQEGRICLAQPIVQRTTTADTETDLDNVYSDELSREIVFSKLFNGCETDVRCISLCALR